MTFVVDHGSVGVVVNVVNIVDGVGVVVEVDMFGVADVVVYVVIIVVVVFLSLLLSMLLLL